LVDIIQCLETELEEKVLRYKLALKDRLHFKWSWQEKLSRGGMECIILAHINTGTSVLSIQNKKHLHWKALEDIPGMNKQSQVLNLGAQLIVEDRSREHGPSNSQEPHS
jgi:hypothetical protein